MTAHVAVLIVNDKIPILVPDPDYEAPSGDASSGDETVPYVHYFTAGTLPKMPWSVGVMSLSLLFFFAVFYSNNCYQRFTVLFGHTVGLGGTTMEWTLLVKNAHRHCQRRCPPAARASRSFRRSRRSSGMRCDSC